MKINKAKVKRILLITLSNVGDAILTTPAIQSLRSNFPQAHLAVLAGPRSYDVFKSDRRIDTKIIFDKTIHWKNKLGLLHRLRQDRYDLVVDLRNTGFSIFLGARYRSSIFIQPPKRLSHMLDRHLWRLKSLGLDTPAALSPSVQFSENDREHINRLLKKWQLNGKPTIVAVGPGARNMTKRWQEGGYIQLIRRLMQEYRPKVIIVGDAEDDLIAKDIISQVQFKIINACGQTSIGQLAFLLTKCKLLVSNDSAPMHLGWAMGTPVVAIFGPTDYKKYAPRGERDIVVFRDLECAPCEESLCARDTRDCMKLIGSDEVFAACKKILDEQK